MKSFRISLRKVATAFACLAAVTVFSGCEPEEVPDNGTDKPGAVIDFTATAGNAQVSLTWNEPTDNGGFEITGYELTMNNWADKVTKTTSERSHTYTGLTNGTEYTFKVRAVNANGTGKESEAKVTPTVSGGGECQTELTQEMVRDGGTFPKCTYIVKGVLQVNKGKILTFAPGTIILFDENQYNAEGGFQGISASIVAKGTEQEPIIFTSAKANKAAGDWSTVQFENCDFEWCTFEYGGSIMRDEFAFSMTSFSGTGSFKHCTLRESVGTGLACGMLTAFEYNTITNCGEWDSEYDYPMIVSDSYNLTTQTHTSGVKKLEAMGQGNVINTAKGVAMGTNVLETTTLHKLNCPYLFDNIYGLHVGGTGTTLTIEPGVQIKIGTGRGDGDLSVGNTCVLIAKGTADDPIIITGMTEAAGNWEGVYFSPFCGAGCILEYFRIIGGGEDAPGQGDAIVEIPGYTDEGSPIVTVHNCYIANSPTWGIYFNCYYGACSQSGNTFANCAVGNYPDCN